MSKSTILSFRWTAGLQAGLYVAPLRLRPAWRPAVQLFAVLLICIYSAAADTGLDEIVKQYNGNKLSILAVDRVTGDVIGSFQPDLELIPASVTKLATSVLAFSDLGVNYRFVTDIVLSEEKEPTLFIRGRGDPSITSEEIWLIARQLWRLGVRSLHRIVFDTSLWENAVEQRGVRAYASGTSATPVNHNSVAVVACPTRPGAPARVLTDPWDLGIPIRGTVMTQSGKRQNLTLAVRTEPRLAFTVSGSIGMQIPCVEMFRSVPDPLWYAGAVFTEILRAVGIAVRNPSSEGLAPLGFPVLFEHRSRALPAIVGDMNHYSSNFIAEQLAHQFGQRANERLDYARGIRRLENFVQSLDKRFSGLRLADASGLSRENRLTARALVAILEFGLANPLTSAELESSLPIWGVSGTLEKRPGRPPATIRAKTGSLSGVNALSGILETKSGRSALFAVVSNDGWSRDRANAFEEQFLGWLARAADMSRADVRPCS